MTHKKTFIFFSNFLGFSGSEVLLKELLNSLAVKTEFKLILVGFTDGDLIPHFDKRVEYISYTEFYKRHNTFGKRQLRRITSNSRSSEYTFLERLNIKYPGATWVLNTIWLCRLFEFININKIPTFIWIHEMPVAFEILSSSSIKYLQTLPQKLICVSECVASGVQSLNPSGEVKTIYPGIFSKETIFKRSYSRSESDVVTIGMSGRVDSNKNPLVFLSLARHLKIIGEKRFKLLWIGGGGDNGLYHYVTTAIANERLEKLFYFTGHLDDTYSQTLQSLDLFMLTSNYDSFPLVMLEASSFGIPILGWPSGGITEFINSEKIGRIMTDRSDDALYKILTEYYKNKNIFNPQTIQQRSSLFSKELFVESFLAELIQ